MYLKDRSIDELINSRLLSLSQFLPRGRVEKKSCFFTEIVRQRIFYFYILESKKDFSSHNWVLPETSCLRHRLSRIQEALILTIVQPCNYYLFLSVIINLPSQENNFKIVYLASSTIAREIKRNIVSQIYIDSHPHILSYIVSFYHIRLLVE